MRLTWAPSLSSFGSLMRRATCGPAKSLGMATALPTTGSNKVPNYKGAHQVSGQLTESFTSRGLLHGFDVKDSNRN